MTRQQFIVNVKTVQKAFRRFLTALCCGDSHLADDIAQESFIKAWLSIDNLKKLDNFSSWIYRIGYNTFLNQCRYRKHHPGYEAVVFTEAEETADSSFRYQELYAALNRLTPTERTSILLYYMEGYSVKEIAEIENVGVNAVKQHLSRGRRHLKSLMANE